MPCVEATQPRDGKWVETAGIIIVRQRPGSGDGKVFITIKDETGITNVVVWPDVFEKYRRVILSSRILAVRGRI